MDATKSNIGKNKSSRRTKTKTTSQTAGRVRPLAPKAKDSERNTERKAEIRTHSNASDGFLKCRFLPKQEERPILQDCRIIAKTEREFYRSLSNLANQYGVEPMLTKKYDFPYNIALAMWDMECKLKQVNIEWDDFKLIRQNNEILFAREDCFRVYPFYYIPIVPLFQQLKDPNRKRNAQLLLSVCSYLYHIADIPYYRQQDSYLYWIYEMHEEWMEHEDEEDEDIQQYKQELTISKIIGDKMEQKLFNYKNLEMFEQRLNLFECHTDFDEQCRQVATNAFSLYTEYPSTTIFRNQHTLQRDPYDDDYGNEPIRMDMYISFIACTKGILYRHIEESINAEFNECLSIEEPTIYTPIDGTVITKADFDFENRLFTLLDDLYSVINT
jgi:hypothetical protein